MSIYGYQPVRALQIIDSAVIVGNLSEMQAEICRARILSSTLMKEHIDSMLGGRTFIALDSAQRIGERMLRHDSVKSNLKRQKEVLEILAYTAHMLTAFQKIEQGVREATAREHMARYDALQKQIEAERQEVKSRRAYTIAYSSGFFALLVIAIAIVVIFKNRAINRKNHLLAQQISVAVNYKKMYWEKKRTEIPVEVPQETEVTDEQLFQYISDIIVREQLFLDPKFGRQTIMDRFQLSKERVGAIFSKGSQFSKLTSYVLNLRLEHAAKLLLEQPDKNIVQIATECGFSSSTYFSDRFRLHFGLSPSDFRREASSNFQHQTDQFV